MIARAFGEFAPANSRFPQMKSDASLERHRSSFDTPVAPAHALSALHVVSRLSADPEPECNSETMPSGWMSSDARSLSTHFVLFRAAEGLVFSYFVRAGAVVSAL
jgi:hypothetical protein